MAVFLKNGTRKGTRVCRFAEGVAQDLNLRERATPDPLLGAPFATTLSFGIYVLLQTSDYRRLFVVAAVLALLTPRGTAAKPA